MRRALSSLPPLVLVASAGWLAAHWAQLPPQWPIHWGPEGRPDLYASRTPLSAFAPLLAGALLWAALEALARGVQGRPNPRLEAADARTLASASADLVRWAALALTLVVAGVGAALPLYPGAANSRLVPLGIFAGLIIWLGIGLAGLRARTRNVKLPEGHGPLVYSNTGDNRLWVPKASGLGWTLNMAHPHAWPILLLLAGGPALLTLLLMYGLRSTSG